MRVFARDGSTTLQEFFDSEVHGGSGDGVIYRRAGNDKSSILAAITDHSFNLTALGEK